MRWYLTVLGFIGCIGIISTVLILLKMNPETFPILAPSLLAVSVFFSLFSLTSIAGYMLRRFFFHTVNRFSQCAISVRQGVLFGLFSVYVLFLFSVQAFAWWTALCGILVLAIIEWYMLLHTSKE